VAGDTGMTGDWRGALKAFGAFPDRFREAVQLATRQNVLGLEREIKQGMQNQAPGGVPYQPLSSLTIALRLAEVSVRTRKKIMARAAEMEAAGGVGHKALINHGDLLGSVTHALSPDGMSGAVGVNRKAKTKDGKDVVDIAKVVFCGATITVTARMRAWFRSQGHPLKPSTTAIIIPPRPTIEPAYKAYFPQIRNRYQQALLKALPPR
jgi:hypothetical protein